MNNTETYYLIRVLQAKGRPNVWYANKRGLTFEATKAKREGVEIYKVSDVLFIHLEDAEVLSVRRRRKYSRL